MAKDYYKVLGVASDATAEDIKRAYRRLAHQHHPDKAGGNEETFKQVNEAYQVLSDDEKRASYDRFGDGVNDTAGGFQGGNVNYEDLGGIGDIFEQFFGGSGRGARRGPAVRRGQDVGVDITIGFLESAQGVQRELTTRLYHTCGICHGNGAKPGTPIKTCVTCQGQGQVMRTQQTVFGMFQQASTCPTCQGEGKTAEQVCSECRGEGRKLDSRTLRVDVPAGIADSQTIRLTGKGEAPSRGGMPGDLYVTVHVEPHSSLRRVKDIVRVAATISFADAALGTTVDVPTLQGTQEIKIAAGTQPGTEIKLEQQGFPRLQGSGRGDQIVTVNVEIPKKLSRQQKKLLEEFRRAPKKRSLF